MQWRKRVSGGTLVAPVGRDPRLITADAVDPQQVYPMPSGAEVPHGWEPEPWTEPFEQNVVYKRWQRRVAQGDPNDLVVAISASPKHTGVTGTGKSTLALNLAKHHWDISDRGFVAADKATLSPLDVGDMYAASQRGSCLIFDEAQGTGAGDEAGVNARRGMSDAALEAIGKIAANRNQAITLILVAQSVKWLDKNLLDLVDIWIRIKYEPSDPRGPLATAYELYQDDMEFESATTKTPVLSDLTWGRIPADDADYQTLERLKNEATRETADEDPSIPTEIRDKKIKKMSDVGIGQQEIAETFDISQSRVSQIVS